MPDHRDKPNTTQRAYTLRLRGTDKNDNSWRDALWATHEAVNKGAKVFGDWLLTLRGGLDHRLERVQIGDEEITKELQKKESEAKKKKETPPTRDEVREELDKKANSMEAVGNRRILLALSWLSVESESGAPNIAAKSDDPPEKILAALYEILANRGVDNTEIGDLSQPIGGQQGTWLHACKASLDAMIRKDAVWVNRSRSFDELLATGTDTEKARRDAKTLLWFILKDDYLTFSVSKKAKKNGDTTGENDNEDENDADERQKAVSKSSKGAAQRTRHPFSHLLGAGKPFGKPGRSLLLRDKWHEHLKKCLLAQTGIPVRGTPEASKTDGQPEEDGRSQSELHREMFSKAASRLAQIWTKQRQQEADRQGRQAADADLKKMEGDAVFAAALSALTAYCAEYRIESGATVEFRIRPAQITGWERIIASWACISDADPERAEEKRIEAVKESQEENKEKKFGDPNLFIRFADRKYCPVWMRNNATDADILKRFVAGMKARSEAHRLKVAAYRHPHAYLNPVFCQFGVSRPAIEFRRLKAFTDEPAGNDLRAIGLLTWNPSEKRAKITVLNGSSLRFDREIGSACDAATKDGEKLPKVTRRGRLGAAAAGLATPDIPAKVAGVFDPKAVDARSREDGEDVTGGGRIKEPRWNGSLAAVRGELAGIQKELDKAAKETDAVKKMAFLERAEKRKKQLRWSLVVSMELEQNGPWYKFIQAAPDKTPFARTVPRDEETGKKRKRGTQYIDWDGWPFEEINKLPKLGKDGSLVKDTERARKGHAKLMLSRLPGLRLLSVDLGHRYAASCAVWETLTSTQMEAACQAANHVPPAESNLFLHIPTSKADGRKRTTIFRRIGPDKLDGIEHPAPWARLERQFLIKLQGEETSPRAASTAEAALVKDLAARLGLLAEEGAIRSRRVDELMARGVRIATLALKRHARRAKIAYALGPKTNTLLGVGGKPTIFQQGDATHIKLLTDALFDWHAMASESKWDDQAARELWNQHVATPEGAWKIYPPRRDAGTADDRTRQQRRKDEDSLREKLKPLAENLTAATRTTLFQAWHDRWHKDDGNPRLGDKAAAGFHADLRQLTDWIMGRSVAGETSVAWKRHVGGISLTRIATMKSLYQLHKAFAMRATPDRPRGAPDKGETNVGLADSILTAMERMRENRVKQLASRIAGSALGLGGHWKEMELPEMKDGRSKERWVWQEEPSPKYAPCHAVVIEDLTNYRPEETRTRRENRQLMSWSSSKVKKYLAEACQLHGLHLREVQAGYTSRQDSRTGAPGVRCSDVPVTEFMTAPRWRKQVKTAKMKRDEKDGGAARDRYLLALDEKFSGNPENWEKLPPVRIPANGGELFVSADAGSPAAKGLQADLNAAANIGLKVLLDPDFTGKWWYVPCKTATYIPDPEKVGGCPLFDDRTPLGTPQASPDENAEILAAGKRRKSKIKVPREIINRWRDLSSTPPMQEKAWYDRKEYWNKVEYRVVQWLHDFIK